MSNHFVMQHFQLFFLSTICLLFTTALSAQLEVTNAAPITPENLISNVFLGDGVEVVSITYEGDDGAVGLFTQGAATLGMDRGIVMTTGSAVNGPGVVGVNSSAGTQASVTTSSNISDNDVRTIVGTGININDVARYTIQFIPTSDTLRFTYSFGSEEYPEFVCSAYNDVFGFFISGPGISGPFQNGAENIALIPGTNRPVTINNVNPGVVGSNGQMVNCTGEAGSLAFSQFYNANFGNNLPVYDGYTDVFVAEAVVQPCSLYTIKLVIADITDNGWDSGVFLEAKSFGTGSLDVEIEGLAIDGGMAEGCGEGEIVFSLPAPVEADFDVEFSVDGTATPGVDYPELPASIIIPEGDSTFRVPISAYEDFLDEGDETILLSIQRDPCNRDTFTIVIKDNQLIKPDLGPDMVVCPTDDTQLDGTVPIILPEPPRFVNNTPLAIDLTNVPFVSEIDVFGVLPTTLGPEAIKMICIDSLEHQWIDDLDLFLVSPDGQFLELTTDNGADGGNGLGTDYYLNTCFTVDAVTPINAPGPFAPPEAMPFTGEWQPEGVFSDLWDGDYSTNGTWQLIVTDDSQALVGTLHSWSICFNPVYQVAYEWSPAAGLSCTNCPDPVASPDTSTTYILTVSDSYGCMESDTINFEVLPALTMSDLQCGELTTSSVEVVWPVVVGATGYEVSVNGGPWMPTSGLLSHVVTGLGLLESVDITVRALANCPSFSTSITCTSLNCTPASLEATPVDVNCFGGSDGSVQINILSGTGPFSYELGGETNDTGTFDNLQADNYVAVVTDGNGCPGNIAFTVAEPPAPNITAVIENALDCNGDADGALTVDVVDGNGPYSFDWGNGITDSIATNLSAGMYSVDLLDQGNCPFNMMIDLPEPELLTATIATDSVACQGENSGLAWITPSGGSGPYTYAWTDGQLTDTAFMLVAGQYNVMVLDSLNCSLSMGIEVLEPTAISGLATATDADCNGSETGSLSISPTGGSPNYSYSWQRLADGMEVGTSAALADQAAGMYEVEVTDANGCVYSSQTTINEPALLSLFDLQTTIPTCTGASDGSATVDVQGGIPPYIILWSTGANGMNENNLTAGQQWVIVTDANMCTDSLGFELDAPVAVTISISTEPASCFAGMDGTATVVPEGGTLPYTYLWSNGDTDPTATGLPAGLASVEVRDANGCLATGEIMVSEPTALAVALTGIDPSCFMETNGSITATPSGGTAPYTYQWSDMQDTDVASGLSAQNYSLVVTDANGCTVADQLTLTEPSALSLTSTTEEQACTGPPNGEAAVQVLGGTMPYTYEWEDGQQTATATGLSAGSYDVTVTDAQNCTVSSTVDVALAESVVILSATASDASCNSGQDGSIAVELEGGTAPYTWSSPLSGLSAGNYELTVTDANNCTDMLNINVGEPSALALNAAITNVVCAGETTGAIDLTVGGATPPYAYSWTGGSTSEDLTNLSSGDYMVWVTDANGCTASMSNTVQQASQLSLAVEIENIACNGVASGHISTNVQGGQSPYDYLWSNGSTNGTLAAVTAGIYDLTVTDDFGCSVEGQYEIVEPAALSGSIFKENVDCHGGQNGFIKADVQGGTAPYRYRVNNENWNASATRLGLGVGTYSMWVEDANGCQFALGHAIINEPAPIEIDLGGHREMRFGDTIRIIPIISSDQMIVEYNWSPYDSTWLACQDCLQQFVFSDVQRDLFLEVIDENGCSEEAWVQIRVSKDFPVVVPTGFTPNGDNVNDRLLVHGLPGIEVISYRIWDRWGELLFEDAEFPVNDPDHGWDGLFRDQAVNGGVYLWQVEVRFPDGRTEVINGQVTLIR